MNKTEIFKLLEPLGFTKITLISRVSGRPKIAALWRRLRGVNLYSSSPLDVVNSTFEASRKAECLFDKIEKIFPNADSVKRDGPHMSIIVDKWRMYFCLQACRTYEGRSDYLTYWLMVGAENIRFKS